MFDFGDTAIDLTLPNLVHDRIGLTEAVDEQKVVKANGATATVVAS